MYRFVPYLLYIYIQLNRKLCIHIYIELERVNYLRWGMNYRTQVIITVLVV